MACSNTTWYHWFKRFLALELWCGHAFRIEELPEHATESFKTVRIVGEIQDLQASDADHQLRFDEHFTNKY